MKKKGDLSLQTIAIIVLTLLVIIVVGYIFRTQIMHFANTIFNLGNDIAPNTDWITNNDVVNS